MQFSDHTFGTVKSGVCVLSGFVTSVREELGHLVVRDGIKGAETERRYPRASCPISRLIAVRSEGYITLAAMHWLDAIGAALVVLDPTGRPVVTSVPRRSVRHSARLRRTQAQLGIGGGRGAEIARELIEAKITGQISLLRELDRSEAADRATEFAAQLPPAGSGRSALLGIEGRVSNIYWSAFADWPIAFTTRDPVPNTWRTFGARRSVLTGRPKTAVSPANAITNYLYNIALSETVIALQAAGLDPTMGILHGDVKDERASAAYDLLEPLLYY